MNQPIGASRRGSRSLAFRSVIVLLAALAGTAHSQAPVRIGASLSQTGSYAALGQNQLRGYQLCVKQANEKGGVLGRKLELISEDDQSQTSLAVAIYEKLITQTKVDLILGPYSSPITEAVADVTEKHRFPMVAPGAAATSIFKKGRRQVFMVYSPAEVYLEGLIDLAAKRGLKTIAIVYEDTIFPKAIAQGTADLAKARGLQVTLMEAYAKGSSEFGGLMGRVRAANPDVLAAATYYEESMLIARQLRELNLSAKVFGVTVGGDLPKFQSSLGSTAEFVYGASQWEGELVTLRAGGLVPIARQYPGAAEFAAAHAKEFPDAGLSYHTASGFSGCGILLEAIRRVGSLSKEKIRDVIAALDVPTAFGPFKVDQDGLQVGHKMVLFQWQDGRKVIVWPEDIAPGRPRFPTPPWSQRK
jgi:branched-chain amino acid transport system substrate-binding protein